MRFDKLAERLILKARAEGQLENLKGEGEPLADRGPEDVATAAGFRVMAEAGALPREIELKREIEQQRRVLEAALGTDSERAEMARLADLEQRLAIEEEARRRLYRTQ